MFSITGIDTLNRKRNEGLIMNTQDKLRNPHLSEKIVTDQIAASWIKDGMTLGLSGFTRAGDAKAVPTALVERAKAESMKVNVFTGASLGSDIDKKMAEVDLVNKRLPFQVDKTMRNKINTGQMWFIDQHLSHTAEALRQEVFGRLTLRSSKRLRLQKITGLSQQHPSVTLQRL